MSKTYYDSELTAEQIEAALNAIADVVNPGNNGKVMFVEDGKIKAASASRWSGGYPEPTGTINIPANGLVDVKDYAEANVQVPGGSEIEVIPLSAASNGTYTAPAGKAYSPVTVNVSGGSIDSPFALSDYLRSDGNQYIDTGYFLTNNSEIEITAAFIHTGAYPALFGARNGYNNGSCFIRPGDSGVQILGVSWGSAAVDTSQVYNKSLQLFGKKTIYRLSQGRIDAATIDGYGLGFDFNKSGSPSSTYPLYVFAFNDAGSVGGSLCTMKFYNLIIRENGTVVMNLMPHVDGNNIACLRDTVSGNLFYNAGTGDFVYGTDA